MKKLNGLDKYVIFSIAVLLTFAIVEMVVSTVSGVPHDTLTTAIYGVFGGEILSCALIKIFKLREEDKECDWREGSGDGNSFADSGSTGSDL